MATPFRGYNVSGPGVSHVNCWSAIGPVVVVAALVAWIGLQPDYDSVSGALYAAPDDVGSPERASADPSPDSSTHPSTRELIALATLLLVGIGVLILISRLHRRRQKAAKAAHKKQKEEVRAADMAQRDLENR